MSATYSVVARNYSQASENKIHSDEVARRYGFRGALVPGVAVYGHLVQPLVERYGAAWLGHSLGSVRFMKPAYHGDHLTLRLADTADGCRVTCENEAGVPLAELVSSMPATLPAPERHAAFDNPAKVHERIDMVWDNVVPDTPFEAWDWYIEPEANATFAAQVDDANPLYETHAHPHWTLGIANAVLTREYVMPAWIHVGTETRFHRALKVGDTVNVQALPLEKWRKKGHEFIRLYVAYRVDGGTAVEAFHTAIFKVAE